MPISIVILCTPRKREHVVEEGKVFKGVDMLRRDFVFYLYNKYFFELNIYSRVRSII